MKPVTKLWIGIAILIILSPLGLILPGYFKTGGAWGEWGADEIQKLSGYVPFGISRLSGLWNAPLRGYAFKGWQQKGAGYLSLAYILSALIGTIIIVSAALLIGKILAKKDG